MKLKRFGELNESEDFGRYDQILPQKPFLQDQDEDQELPVENQPMFSMEELEAAFLSARVPRANSKDGIPLFATFKDWYLQELATSGPRAMRDYPFDMHTRFPFRKSGMGEFRISSI